MPVTTVADESAMQTELQKAGGRLVIVDFTATWCGPCQQMAPYFQELSNKYLSAVFLKVDVDDNSEIAMQFEVTSMPTFLFLKQGEEIDRLSGADPSGLETLIHSLVTSSAQPIRLDSNGPPGNTSGEDYCKPARSQPETLIPTPSSQQPQQLRAPSIKPIPLPTNPPNPSQMATSSLNRGLPPGMQNNQQLQPTRAPATTAADWQMPNIPLHHPSLISQGMFNQSFPPGFDFSQLSQAQMAALSNQMNSTCQLSGLVSAGQQHQLKSQQQLLQQQQQQQKQQYLTQGGMQDQALIRLANHLQETLNENEQLHDKSQEQFFLRRESSKEKGVLKPKRRKSVHRNKSHSRGHQSGHTSRGKEQESHAQKLIKIKKKQPISTVHIRLADGTKMTGQFNTNHPVSKIREFINNARPETSARAFSLNTVFPSREITNEEQTIQEAKLHNSVVIQRWFS